MPTSELGTQSALPKQLLGMHTPLGGLISIVNLNGLEITWQTHLWVCL